MNWNKSKSSFNSSYGFKKLQTKSFKSEKTFKSSWRPYNSQFYVDGMPKMPGVRKDGTPRVDYSSWRRQVKDNSIGKKKLWK